MYRCVMDFYVLKKNDKLKAIPADKEVCKSFEQQGYSYVDKVAACTEQAAIKKLKGEHYKSLTWPIIRLSCVALGIAILWYIK